MRGVSRTRDTGCAGTCRVLGAVLLGLLVREVFVFDAVEVLERRACECSSGMRSVMPTLSRVFTVDNWSRFAAKISRYRLASPNRRNAMRLSVSPRRTVYVVPEAAGGRLDDVISLWSEPVIAGQPSRPSGGCCQVAASSRSESGESNAGEAGRIDNSIGRSTLAVFCLTRSSVMPSSFAWSSLMRSAERSFGRAGGSTGVTVVATTAGLLRSVWTETNWSIGGGDAGGSRGVVGTSDRKSVV